MTLPPDASFGTVIGYLVRLVADRWVSKVSESVTARDEAVAARDETLAAIAAFDPTGTPGRDGRDGIDGRDGLDGQPGATTIEGIAGLQDALDRKADRIQPELFAESGFHLREDGVSFFEKNPDLLLIPASTIKMLTVYLARLYVTDDMLQDTVTILSGDAASGNSAGLKVGDLVTWDTVFHGTLLRSDSTSAHTLARHVGRLIKEREGGTLSDHSTFREKANGLMAQWGWEGAVFLSASGLDTTGRMTTRQLCELMFELDEYTLNVSTTLTFEATATGPNPRTWTIDHGLTERLLDFPEVIGVKTGSIEETAGVVALSEVDGVRHATAVLGVWPSDNRFPDTRTMLNFVE